MASTRSRCRARCSSLLSGRHEGQSRRPLRGARDLPPPSSSPQAACRARATRVARMGRGIIATHSPEFVCFGSRQQVTRLWRTGELLSHGSISSSLVSKSARFQERLDEHGNHEFLFSSKAVIVQGKDDFFAVRCCLAKLSLDLDARGVTILGVGGVENIPEYAKMASRLKVPWCAITDEDKQPDGTIRPKTCEVRAALEQRKTDRDLSKQWPVDLERCLGISTGKATPQWQATNLDPLTLEDAELIPGTPSHVPRGEALDRISRSRNVNYRGGSPNPRCSGQYPGVRPGIAAELIRRWASSMRRCGFIEDL